MSNEMEKLGEVERKLSFYRSPDFQSFLEEHIVGRARGLRGKLESLNLYTQEGAAEAIVALATAKELEAIAASVISNLEQRQAIFQENINRQKFNKDPFARREIETP